MKSGDGGSRLVYSTDAGRMCPDCRQPMAQCSCRSAARAAPAGDGIARVAYEKKGRGGKAVTVVRGLPLDTDALAQLGKQLRSACGAGGTTKDGSIEVQGDHRDTVIAALQKLGHTVKRTGG
ncbi:MAG: translation initiation factor Sui1 [Pseudomonadota bacterium]